MLNVHGTLLPKYAGARTGNWVIVNGDRESGVTVHAIDAGVDTGAILLQKKFRLSAFETAASLGEKLASFEPGVVVDAINLLESGKATFIEQRPDSIQRWPDRNPSHSELDSSRSLKDLVQEILACDPQNYPAYFYHNDRKVYVRIWLDDPEPPVVEELSD
jgi:methionyl-tRNA formyltransferase